MAIENKKVIEAEIVNGDEIKMKEMPEKIGFWKQLGRGIKHNWKKGLAIGGSMLAVGTGSYFLGRHHGTKKITLTNTTTNDDSNYLESPEEEFPGD